MSPQHLAILSKFPNIRREHIAVNDDGRLVIPKTSVELENKNREFLLQGLELLDDLGSRAGAKITTNKQGRVILDVSGIKLIVDCWEELFIAHEVLFRKIYNASLETPFRVVDVGMNTGTSALFFAAQPNCLQVDAYELFPLTAERAVENLAINPELSRKIRSHPFGLGAADEKLLLNYYAEFKGSVGRNGLPEYARPHGVEFHPQMVQVDIRAAAPVMSDLFFESGDTAMILKLDCEGSEYEIVSSLHHESLLKKFSIIMIEWHLRGPSALKSLLKASGFSCLSFDEYSGTHGMLYGFKTRGS